MRTVSSPRGNEKQGKPGGTNGQQKSGPEQDVSSNSQITDYAQIGLRSAWGQEVPGSNPGSPTQESRSATWDSACIRRRLAVGAHEIVTV